MGILLSECCCYPRKRVSAARYLESLHPDTSSYTLQEDDVLLFLSDGITSGLRLLVGSLRDTEKYSRFQSPAIGGRAARQGGGALRRDGKGRHDCTGRKAVQKSFGSGITKKCEQ